MLTELKCLKSPLYKVLFSSSTNYALWPKTMWHNDDARYDYRVQTSFNITSIFLFSPHSVYVMLLLWIKTGIVFTGSFTFTKD